MVELLEDFAKFLFDLFLEPSGLYLRGVCTGLLVALAAGWTIQKAFSAFNKILVFFAIVQPNLKPSPSPYERMNGCLLGLITLLFLGAVALAFLWAFTYALSRYGG